MVKNKDIAGIESAYRGTGLNDADVQAKRKQYGYNEIPERRVGPVKGTLKRLWGLIPWLLEGAMGFELIMGKGIQAAVVFPLLVFSAVTGEIQEERAKKAIGYLRRQLQISVLTLCQRSSNFYPFRSSKNYPLLVSCLLRSGLADQTGFDLFLKPIGVSSNIDSSGVMEDAVEDG